MALYIPYDMFHVVVVVVVIVGDYTNMKSHIASIVTISFCSL